MIPWKRTIGDLTICIIFITYNCFSERGTRRKLPNVPNSQSHNSLNTQSLPRPPKGDTVRREQSESRSRDR